MNAYYFSAFAMFPLPTPSLAVVSLLPIPKDLRNLPDHELIRAIVTFTSQYRELIPDLNKPRQWAGFKAHLAERRQALNIVEFSNHLYELDEHPLRAMSHLSCVKEVQKFMFAFADELGYGDVARQQVADADPERLREFFRMFLNGPLREFCEGFNEAFDDWEHVEENARRYWEEEFPALSPEEQQVEVKDTQILAGVIFFIVCNTIAVMSYRESMTSLVQRALAGGEDADDAMCKAVRVDNNLRQHPKFMARYLQASERSERKFLLMYDNPASPLTYRVRYPGLYFLLAFLDCYGLLDRLSNPQLLDLCDHAKLNKWENRIEDEGYMAKRRNEYLKHKYRQLSMH